ncbi:SAM-dependent methyltransferase [Winogradskya humida]|uniref:S-adenosyl methyltransferase n=1 Tax=Winogradskya humida TaxID=113566 RepID=A0ABQ3ZID8_9ACTN|nr:SAM-dependent methyltransferase [Actinoplanes humidus]GIE18349.1 hypothetical protein Ahu01nite_014510 [Actinoplanes humidus]
MTSRSESDLQARLNAAQPNSARIWNYLLGGKDNFAADRNAAEALITELPEIREFARAGRGFLTRAVTYLTAEAGVRQFIDVGTGLPTADNTHEVAQRIAPESKVVYVDNDPVVLTHARALLTSNPAGATSYIDADAQDPKTILQAAGVTLDFTQPIAVMLIGILGHLPDTDNPTQVVRTFVDALPPGSYLAINDSIITPGNVVAADTAREVGSNYHLRTPAQITAFFDGLDLLDPGVVPTPLWRPTPGTTPAEVPVYCGVARKP